MLQQATGLAEDGNFGDALKMYDLVLKQEPENTRALIDKGATLQNMGRNKPAINSFNRALNISPPKTLMRC